MALGAVLLQEYDDNWHPVAYASWKLIRLQKRITLSWNEKHWLLYLLWKPSSWRLYLFKHFDVFTDYRSVVYSSIQATFKQARNKMDWVSGELSFLDPSHSRERELCRFVDSTGRDYHRSWTLQSWVLSWCTPGLRRGNIKRLPFWSWVVTHFKAIIGFKGWRLSWSLLLGRNKGKTLPDWNVPSTALHS